jgi:hypothetical protein
MVGDQPDGDEMKSRVSGTSPSGQDVAFRRRARALGPEIACRLRL